MSPKDALRLPAGSRELLARAAKYLAQPAVALEAGAAMLNAQRQFRACARLGARPRLMGNCLVGGGEGIEIGDRFRMSGETVRGELTTHDGGRLLIGENVFINYGCSISAHTRVSIGSNCQIGQYAILLDCDYHSTVDDSHGLAAPITLEDGVWLAARVIVLKGVTIGRGSVVAAGSVVTKDIPPGVLAAGSPARAVRTLTTAPSKA